MQDNIHDITHSKLYGETRDEILTGAQHCSNLAWTPINIQTVAQLATEIKNISSPLDSPT
jgi:hypothetical protein